jgi:hypothetical protein
MATAQETHVGYAIFDPNELDSAAMRLEKGPYLIQRLHDPRLEIDWMQAMKRK